MSFVPALGRTWLTPLYDPLIRSWSAAARIRSSVIAALELRPGLRILELGAGPGRLAIQIKRGQPEVEVDAIDVDPSMVARAQRNAAGLDIAFRAADMTCLPDAGCYDRVYSTMVFHHLAPAAKVAALATARRLLRPDGHFVVADFGRPRDPLQWALFTAIQQPLDGVRNTSPHRDGRYERALRDAFSEVSSAQAWRTIAGTIELFVCR